MKVLIVDGLHDSDRGGAGIIAGLVDSLRRAASDNHSSLDIGLVYRYSEDDPRFASAARHTRKTFPELTIYGTPISTKRWPNDGPLRRKLRSLSRLCQAFAKQLWPSLFPDKVSQAMRDADFVISKGGHFYQSLTTNLFAGFVQSIQSYHNLIMARRLGKRFALVSHSVGPFNSSTSRWLTRVVFNRANYIGVREEQSKQILTGLGITESRIEVIPDTGFALTPASQVELGRYLNDLGLNPKEYAIVTARHWNFGKRRAHDAEELNAKYLGAMAQISDFIVDEGIAKKILLVVHNDGQHERHENDGPPMQQIFEQMRRKDAAQVIDDDLSPMMQSALYGQAAITIGTRMHSVIFALVGGGPAIAVSYIHKTDGIMKMLGFERYVIPIDDIDVNSAKETIRSLKSEEEKVKEVAREKIREFRTRLEDTLSNIAFVS